MKNSFFNIIAVLFLCVSVAHGQAGSFNFTNPPNPPYVLKGNTVSVGNNTYYLPPSIQLTQLPNGQFQMNSPNVLAHKVGNGGDYIRATFIQLGTQIISYLKTTDMGNNVVVQNHLDTTSLTATLDVNRIVVTDDTLFDNTGSVVDAIGVPGLIILNGTNWLDHFENERDIYYLVFHEMLRSAQVNDDNFVISKSLMDFPTSFKVATRLLPLVPMLEQDSIQNLFSLNSIVSSGSGCPQNSGQYYSDLDLTKNTFELTLNNFSATSTNQRPIDYKFCDVSIPVQLPAHKKLTISLIDLQGQTHVNSTSLQTTNTLSFEAFLTGTSNNTVQKVIQLGGSDRSFLFRKTDVLSSGCGTAELIRLSISNRVMSQVSSVADTGDGFNSSEVKKISVYLNLEDCN